MNMSVLSLASLISLPIWGIFAFDCGFDVDSLLTQGYAFDGHQFWSTITMDVAECAVSCTRRKICKSFNFDTEMRICQLNSESGTPSKSGINHTYSDISDWPSQVDPNCYDRPCGDDEVCIPGGLTGGDTCSYSCFKLYRRCPLPEGVRSSSPRTVGSTYTHTCNRGYIGGDTALCLPNQQWNKALDTTCTLLYGSGCDADANCAAIDGTCIDKQCACVAGLVYDVPEITCVRDCGANWIRYGSGCYLFEMQEMVFSAAETFCENAGAHLVQVDSVDEREFLKTQMMQDLSPPQFGYWNDLYQWAGPGSETWKTTNDSLNPQEWFASEPNDNVGYERCTIAIGQGDYRWADMPCEDIAYPSRPLCEK